MPDLSVEDAQKLVQDPMRWFYTMTGFNPYPTQADVLQDESRKQQLVKGRQTGGTTVYSHKLGREPMRTQDPGLGLVISVTDSQSKMVLRNIEQGYMRSPFAHKLVKSNERELIFDTGYKIISRAVGNSGKAARGYSPNVVYATEAAYIKDAVYEAVEPSLFNTGGKLWLESSPNGTSGRFYRAWDDNSFSSRRVTSRECPGVSQGDLSDFQSNFTSMKYQQEVMAEFVSDQTSYFSTELIRENQVLEDLRVNRVVDHNQYFLGVDIARKGEDQTVYCVLERPSGTDKLYVKELISEEKKRTTNVTGQIISLDRKYNFDSIGIDANSIGAGVTDSLVEQNVEHHPFPFSGKNKHEMYEGLKFKMENNMIRLPDSRKTDDENHQSLYEQMNSLQYEFRSNGRIKVYHPKGGHDDFPDALAAAAFVSDDTDQTKREKGRPFML